MTINNISSAPSQEAAPQQPVSKTPPNSRADRLEEAEAAAKSGRNTAAARGEELPRSSDEQEPDQASVESAVSRISDFVQNFQRDLQFSVDKESDRLVVKVVDSETQEVIRQIPSEETLRIAQNLDSPESLILREQA